MKILNFANYWKKAKKLSLEERAIYFSSFSKNQQKTIKRSFNRGRWKDVFLYNQIDELCDLVRDYHGIDLFDLRIKIIIKKEKVIISKKIWDDILAQFSKYENCFNLGVLFGGIHSQISETDPSFYVLFCK